MSKKKYSCVICDKSFNQKGHKNVHMRVHTGERPYSCGVCEMSFTNSYSLSVHKRQHTGEKPYPCSICDKSFCQKVNKECHMRTCHTGEKPYSCDVCDKLFSLPSTLHKHMKTHTGEKPYSCDVCGKSFSQSSNKERHRKTHKGEKPKSCVIYPCVRIKRLRIKRLSQSEIDEWTSPLEVEDVTLFPQEESEIKELASPLKEKGPDDLILNIEDEGEKQQLTFLPAEEEKDDLSTKEILQKNMEEDVTSSAQVRQ